MIGGSRATRWRAECTECSFNAEDRSRTYAMYLATEHGHQHDHETEVVEVTPDDGR